MISTHRKFIIFTWGCQMNEDDAEQIASLLMQMGYSPTDTAQEADLAMLVTCSVRAKPEQKAKSKLGELRVLKESNPDMLIGVCGCMAQKEGDALKKGRPYLDFVIGTNSIWQIPELVCEAQTKRKFRSALSLPSAASDALTLPPRTSREAPALKSFVPVMYGCDNFCSYCVVPHVRGRERSREMDDIVREVRELAGNGRKEVTLLGQNVNSYGSTLSSRVDFSDLLGVVSKTDGIERIRFTTSHPKDLSDRLIGAMRDLPKVCEHIHLAVQSGDDEILARMNRKYTSDHVRERVAALRDAVPHISITTDFLVGFPGETDEQFDSTLHFAEEMRFDAAFMFAFNPIPRTAAAAMEDQLSTATKNERLNRLIRVQNAITCEINNASIGQVCEVLVEGVSPKDVTRVTGLARQNKTVNFVGNDGMMGKLVQVRVTEGHLYGFVGEVADAGPAGVAIGR